jgi:hypothetical protein
MRPALRRRTCWEARTNIAQFLALEMLGAA